MDRMEHVRDICLRMEDIAAEAGLERFDRVRYDMDAEEVWFLWETHDPPLAIVIEMTDDVTAMGDAFLRATAPAGDPVLN